MSGKARARVVIMWITVVLTVLTLAVYVTAVFTHRGNPVWNRALLTYCGVFWVFLAFDEIGRRAAAIGAAKRTVSVRPRPQPQANMPLPGAAGVRAGGGAGAGSGIGSGEFSDLARETRLTRVDAASTRFVQSMVNDCVKEVLALDGEVPTTEMMTEFDVDAWLRNDAMYVFVIGCGDEAAGVVVLVAKQNAYELLLMYVRQNVRRQHIGQSAFARVEEFARLLGSRNTLVASVSDTNMRGQRFYQSVGMASAGGRTDDSIRGQAKVTLTKSLQEPSAH
ncbi:GNAT family N-acetyltransferase [Alicyclobacillus curvatus]|nr:GNAT family N-acetyltransferase [Alicyclobacillus curvatus]